jgi:hypothetical protein
MIDVKFVERFLKSVKLECPQCGSSNIDMDWKEDEDNEIILENICEDCTCEWIQRYRLVEEYMTGDELDSQ